MTYRARLKAADLQGRAYLEMWCRLPGRGEFFSKGIQDAVSGTTDWSSYEIPFRLAQELPHAQERDEVRPLVAKPPMKVVGFLL